MTAPPADWDDITPDRLRRRGSLKWSLHGPGVLNFWVAEMDFPAAPVVRAAAADVVEREEFGYPVGDQASGLPAAVADWQLYRYGWKVDPSSVHTVPDVLKGVELAIERFSPSGSAVVLPTPAYMPFFVVPTLVNRPIVEVPTSVGQGRRTLDLERIEAAFRAGAGTLILCNPYNPLGRVFSRPELEALSQVVDRSGGRVVSDEIHAPLTYPGSSHVPYASISEVAARHTVTVVSASKAWNLPGLKCAQVITSNPLDEGRWQSMPAMKTYGASTIGIRTNEAAFRHGGPWLELAIAYLDGNRTLLQELLADHLPGVGYVPPEGTYMAWLDCRPLDINQEPSAFFLERARVATSAGAEFGGDGAGHIRFNFATSRSILERGVEAMGSAVHRRRRR
jgi:cystathionine beta-lyase